MKEIPHPGCRVMAGHTEAVFYGEDMVNTFYRQEDGKLKESIKRILTSQSSQKDEPIPTSAISRQAKIK